MPLAVPDLRGTVLTGDYKSHIAGNGGGAGGRYFSVGYYELTRLVRRPGIESDLHLLGPMEYHADTTELVQMLVKGHQNVQLDRESWDRLITWIDLNTPYHGTWAEIGSDPGPYRWLRRPTGRRPGTRFTPSPRGFGRAKDWRDSCRRSHRLSHET